MVVGNGAAEHRSFLRARGGKKVGLVRFGFVGAHGSNPGIQVRDPRFSRAMLSKVGKYDPN